ncbi:MAG: divalent-cation tolerance protein CutA [Saprospiraceae bacterium]
MPFLVFYITYPDEATARSISESLVIQRLAACANVFPIQSVYWWEGAVQKEGEWVSILKTHLGQEDTLEKAIAALHPYEVPCIMRFEARANAAYERWVEACCTPELRSGDTQ